jgi:Fe-S cluster assembly iron-binding protein IscA
MYSRTQYGCSKVAYSFYYAIIIGSIELEVVKKDDDKVIENDSVVIFIDIQIKCCYV